VMDPEDAARLLEDLKGVARQDEYHASQRPGWTGAWITEVRQVPLLRSYSRGGLCPAASAR
jgi:hypothetical protein